jgi:hypothetical protein
MTQTEPPSRILHAPKPNLHGQFTATLGQGSPVGDCATHDSALPLEGPGWHSIVVLVDQ